MQGQFHKIHLTSKFPYFFSILYFCSITGGSKKCRNAHTCHLYTCGQRSLWHKIYLKLAIQQLSFKFSVLTNIGTHHFFYLPRNQQLAKTKSIYTSIVTDALEVFYLETHKRCDTIFRNAG